jgi:L-ribulose-5-phosphate 3-epimerase
MSKIHNKIGIMNGRLSESINGKIQEFPKHSWKQEFESASVCGFELMEWIFDTYEKNPLMDNDGIKEILNLSQKTGIVINSVLADFFMEKRLVNVSEFVLQKNLDVLEILIKNCNRIGVKILEIPFVDVSSLSTKEDQSQLVFNLQRILPLLDEYDILLTLETDLVPKSFSELIKSFNHSNIKANYDVGNSAALGYNITEELTTFGNLISNIHIKDRKFHGQTVPLGTGDVDFDLFFNSLRQINYDGNFIIQGAREIGIKPENTSTKYLQFVKKYAEKYLFDDNNESNGT